MLAARLNKKLMALLFGKADNLIFNTRTISWSHSVNFSAVKGRAADIFKNDPFCFAVGIGHVARQLVFNRVGGIKRKRNGFFVSVLFFKGGKVNASAVDSCRCAGFKPPCGYSETLE